VTRVRPYLGGGSTLVVVGAGGLGQFAIQLARLLTGATVVAVDAREGQLERARALGAHQTVAAGAAAAAAVLDLTRGRGADAVIDFVGTDDSLALAAKVVGKRGLVALLGLAGGLVGFGFSTLAPEAALTTVVAGTVLDLQEVVKIAQTGQLRTSIETYPLEAFDTALADLRAGQVEGRAVLVP
jgi:propanol-preferring alcohol dehydrogenase